MGVLLALPTLCGFYGALLDLPWGAPLLVVAGALATVAGQVPVPVLLGAMGLLTGAMGVAARCRRVAPGPWRWLPPAGLALGGAVGLLVGHGGLGLFYGMIGGTMAAGLARHVAAGTAQPPSFWLLEALRWLGVAVAGIWLVAHLL